MTINHSKNYLDACYAMARRILKSIGEEASVFDIFTKRQKQEIFRMVLLPPRVQAMPGHMVPRQYIRYIQENLIMSLKREYYDKEAGITFMDMATVGVSMILAFEKDSVLTLLSDSQLAIVERLHNAFETHSAYARVHNEIIGRVRIFLMMLSQPNFRIYGQDFGDCRQSGKVGFFQVMHITTHESQSIRFNHHNRERIAYRIAAGQYLEVPYTGATISMKKIFPHIARDRELNIYIQSHAIHRFKERINTVFPIMRNEFFVLSLMAVQRIVHGPDGIQLIACITPVENGEKTIGYFAFTIDGDNLLVLTLLPLLSHSVPEGRILCNRLHLSSADLTYLGMDKLSFFYEVDIEQIPVLKQVLYDELHLDYVRTVYYSFRPKNAPFDEKKTLFVKNFFRKPEEYTLDHSEVLNELTANEQLTEQIPSCG
jgi:hypothetical protein